MPNGLTFLGNTMSDLKEIKIEPAVRELADKIKEVMVIDGNTKLASVADGTYVKLLPAGVTEEQIKAVQEHNTTFIAAGALAFGEASINAMKADEKLDAIELSIPTVGSDTFGFNFKRSAQVPTPGSKETHTSFGQMRVKAEVYATGSRGELANVKKQLAADALAAFGS